MLSRRTLLQGAAAGLAVASHASVFASEKQTPQTAGDTEKTPLNVFLFEGFETIDAMGPVEMLAYAGVYDIRFYGMIAGVVKSAQGVPVAVEAVKKADPEGLLLLPGAAPQCFRPNSSHASRPWPSKRPGCSRFARVRSFSGARDF